LNPASNDGEMGYRLLESDNCGDVICYHVEIISQSSKNELTYIVDPKNPKSIIAINNLTTGQSTQDLIVGAVNTVGELIVFFTGQVVYP
jgi:hypothetical protein